MAAPSIEQRALSAASAVAARVITGTVVLHDDPRRWLEREVSVLRFLAPSGLAVRPSPLIAPGPYQRDGLWLTFCERVDHRGRTELGAGAEKFGRVLRGLHDELARFNGELGDFLDLWRDIERLHRRLRPTDALSPEHIDALRERLLALRGPVFESPLPAQALHGDMSLSNLLSTANGLVWSDFEDAFRGPVHETSLTAFATAHDLYGEIWQLYIAGRRGGLTGG
jgi:hypothetical protein